MVRERNVEVDYLQYYYFAGSLAGLALHLTFLLVRSYHTAIDKFPILVGSFLH